MTQKPRAVETDAPWAKPPEDWPCHCCSCTHETTGDSTATRVTALTDPDPRCHVHGHHGQRGCAKHGVEPETCDCGCRVDNFDVEQARNADYLLRVEQHEHRERFAGTVGVNREDTKEGLAALKAAKVKVAAEQAVQQQAALQAALQPAIDAAVEAALAKQAEANT